MTAKLRLLLVDACVLIDFAKSDSSVITLASRYVGDVHVATPVFEEVHDLLVFDRFLARVVAVLGPRRSGNAQGRPRP